MQPDEKKKTEADIKDFMENHTDATVSFTITADKAKIDEWETLPKGGLYAKFKLTSSLTNSNMTLFDAESRIVRYESPEDILKEFYTYRMDYYVKRKALLVQKLEREQRMLSNKARFVQEVCDGQLVVSNRKKVALLEDLQRRKYELFDKNDTIDDIDEDEDVSTSVLSRGYEYLLGMKIWSLTYEKAEDLRRQLDERTKELQTLQATSPSRIWLNDLDSIDIALDARDEEYAAFEAGEKYTQNKSKKAQAKRAKAAKTAAKKKSKKKDEWDSDLESDSDGADGAGSDSSGDEVEVVKKTAPARKPLGSDSSGNEVGVVKKTAPARKPLWSDSSGDEVGVVKKTAPARKPLESDSSADEVEVVKKTAPARKPLAPVTGKSVLKPLAKSIPAKAPGLAEIVEPEDDESELSLAEPMATLPNKTKSASSSLTTLTTSINPVNDARGVKRSRPQNDASRASGSPVPKRKKAVATKKAPIKKQVRSRQDSIVKMSPTKRKVPAKKSTSAKKSGDSESEDDMDFHGSESESEIEEAPAPVLPRAGRKARATSKKIVFDLSES